MLCFSEAIRLGSMVRPQARFRFSGDGSCAFGAALEAVGGIAEMDPWPWPELLWREDKCPACGKAESVVNIVMHLNDLHRWVRERIADWVEEREGEPETVGQIAEHAC